MEISLNYIHTTGRQVVRLQQQQPKTRTSKPSVAAGPSTLSLTENLGRLMLSAGTFPISYMFRREEYPSVCAKAQHKISKKKPSAGNLWKISCYHLRDASSLTTNSTHNNAHIRPAVAAVTALVPLSQTLRRMSGGSAIGKNLPAYLHVPQRGEPE